MLVTGGRIMHKLYSSNLNTQEKRQLKAKVIEEFNQSTMSPNNFCKLHGIKLKDFYNWRKRFTKDSASLSPAQENKHFIPLIGIGEPWVLKLQGCHELQISHDFDAGQLKKLLQIIGGCLC